MAIMSIFIPEAQINDAKRRLGGISNALPKVVSRSVNKVANSSRTSAVRELAQKTGLKQKDLREYNTKITKASYTYWVARLLIVAKPISLLRLKARQTARGISYRFAGAARFVAGAFIPRKGG